MTTRYEAIAECLAEVQFLLPDTKATVKSISAAIEKAYGLGFEAGVRASSRHHEIINDTISKIIG